MAKVLLPIPRQDFDPTEVAVSWKVLNARGHEVDFATPDGLPASGDQIMIDGIGLDPWGRAPGLKRLRAIGLVLRANKPARTAYLEMLESNAFRNPILWEEALVSDYQGLLLAGGHRARGMREYLESPVLQALVANFFAADKPVAAICHGVLLAARSKGPDGRSVLHGRRTTALTWSQERAADALARIGRPWDPNYYRTYLEEADQHPGHMSVEQEVTRSLASPQDFINVPKGAPGFHRKTSGLHRDSLKDSEPAWVIKDGAYISARWPGDAHQFAKTLADLLDR